MTADTLEALIEQWRENERRAGSNAVNEALSPLDKRQCLGVAQAYSQCADELAALVRAGGTPPVEATAQEPPESAIEAAVSFSKLSPCRSKRGVAIFFDEQMRGGGYNYKPGGLCDGSEACKATCRDEAVHAEQQALLSLGRRANGCEMLHVKTVDGVLVPSGPPSCVQCSKLALAAGIVAIWLFRGEDGWVRYPADVFHDLSLRSARSTPPPAELVQRLARARYEQYVVDGYQQLADAVTLFADEICRATPPPERPQEPVDEYVDAMERTAKARRGER